MINDGRVITSRRKICIKKKWFSAWIFQFSALSYCVLVLQCYSSAPVYKGFIGAHICVIFSYMHTHTQSPTKTLRLHHPFMGEIQFCFKTIFMNGSLIYTSIIGSDLLHIYFEVHNFLCNTKIKGEILDAFIIFTTKQLRDECSLPAWHRCVLPMPLLHDDVIKWKHFPSLALCAGNSPVIGEFPSQRPETRSFDIFFDLPE